MDYITLYDLMVTLGLDSIELPDAYNHRIIRIDDPESKLIGWIDELESKLIEKN